MTKNSVMVVMHPREVLRDVLFERTCDLARYLKDIESAELRSRETTSKGLIRCVHHWRARVDVPSLLAPHIDAGFLEWIGYTEWRADQYESRWVVKPRYLKDSALCEANMRLVPAVGGRGTRVELELEVLRLNGPAGMQAITSTILTTHFRKLVEAAARLIEDQ
jgi:hypothetical protein